MGVPQRLRLVALDREELEYAICALGSTVHDQVVRADYLDRGRVWWVEMYVGAGMASMIFGNKQDPGRVNPARAWLIRNGSPYPGNLWHA